MRQWGRRLFSCWRPWCCSVRWRTWLGPSLHRSAKVAGKLVRVAFLHQSSRCPSWPRSPRVPLCLACGRFVGACNHWQPTICWDHVAAHKGQNLVQCHVARTSALGKRPQQEHICSNGHFAPHAWKKQASRTCHLPPHISRRAQALDPSASPRANLRKA